MLRRGHFTLFVLSITLNSIAFASLLERFFGSSPKCTKYISAEVTVTSTLYQTCGYVPNTALPGCPTIQARNLDFGFEDTLILPAKVMSSPTLDTNAIDNTDDSVPSPSGWSLSESVQPSFDDNSRQSRPFPYISQLIFQISLFSFSCVTSVLSTSVTTVTQVVSSPYTCVITRPIILLPFYQGDCQDEVALDLFTCGYVNSDSTIPTCNKRRRAFLHEGGSEQAVLSVSPIQRIPRATMANKLIPAGVRDGQINATIVSTLVVPNLYSCYDTRQNKLFPEYNSGDCTSISLCSSTSTISTTSTTTVSVACGTIPAGKLPLCPAKRSLVDPSSLQTLELTHTVADTAYRRVPEIESSLSQPSEKMHSFSRSPRVGRCASYILSSTTTIISSLLIPVTSAFTCYTKVTQFSPAYVRGFCIAAESVISGSCTIFRDVTSGTFTSPNYPNNYAINTNVCWVIIAPQGKKITLTFTDFKVEFITINTGTGVASTSSFCPYDMVQIYDGASASTSSSPVIACGLRGSITPNVFTSTSNYMYVTFTTDDTYQYRGFSASFTIA